MIPVASHDGKNEKRKQQIVAVIVSLLAAFAMAQYLRSNNDTEDVYTPSSAIGAIVGDLQSVEGTVQIRLPKSTHFVPARTGPIAAETLIQTQSASAAVIEFRPGPTIRLMANSRIVAEVDPTRDGVIHATLIAGEISVLNPGTSETFTISQNGAPLKFREGPLARTVPLIPVTSGDGSQAFQDSAGALAEKLESDRESELSTVPEPETPLPLATPKLNSGQNDATKAQAASALVESETNAGLIRSTLTNDDIRSQVKAQAGSLQKCYVAMVNRMSETSTSASGKGELPRGEIRVSFKILSSGKLEEPKVLQSPFKDQTFERCTAEALGRMRFRPFQGPTIPVGDFPIVLE